MASACGGDPPANVSVTVTGTDLAGVLWQKYREAPATVRAIMGSVGGVYSLVPPHPPRQTHRRYCDGDNNNGNNGSSAGTTTTTSKRRHGSKCNEEEEDTVIVVERPEPSGSGPCDGEAAGGDGCVVPGTTGITREGFALVCYLLASEKPNVKFGAPEKCTVRQFVGSGFAMASRLSEITCGLDTHINRLMIANIILGVISVIPFAGLASILTAVVACFIHKLNLRYPFILLYLCTSVYLLSSMKSTVEALYKHKGEAVISIPPVSGTRRVHRIFYKQLLCTCSAEFICLIFFAGILFIKFYWIPDEKSLPAGLALFSLSVPLGTAVIGSFSSMLLSGQQTLSVKSSCVAGILSSLVIETLSIYFAVTFCLSP
ncbi:hypothetical protein Pelo_6478 [Pelomyxa schiedti]|nr:hypothetical protein Pelo_6478 [Pelomyxa schiedti]